MLYTFEDLQAAFGSTLLNKARRLLDCLFETEPGYRLLGGLERLVVAGSM